MKIFDFSNYSSIAFIGDVHENITDLKREMSKLHGYIIICPGDFNISDDTLEHYLELFEDLSYILERNENKLCIIRGNHDNPKFFKEKSTLAKDLEERSSQVHIVPDYSIIKTKNHNVLCIGGARSIDRVFSYKNRDWWTNETVQKPADDFYEQVGKHKVDTIVSHAAPLFAKPTDFSKNGHQSSLVNAYAMYDKTLKNDIYLERLLLKGVYDKLNSKTHIQHYVYSQYHKSLAYNFNKTKMVSLGKLEVFTLDD